MQISISELRVGWRGGHKETVGSSVNILYVIFYVAAHSVNISNLLQTQTTSRAVDSGSCRNLCSFN